MTPSTAADVAGPCDDQPIPSLARPKNLEWRIFKNSAAQVLARVLIALSRLVVAGYIVRTYGKNMFGEYSLVFGILSIADWLVDFGTTDVFVREICPAPEQGPRLLRLLSTIKLLQIPAAFTVLAVLMFALRYPGNIIQAGLVGGVNLIFFAGVLVCRVIFKVTLTLEREAASELISVLVMIPMVALVCHYRWGLLALIACHVISRSVFCSSCLFFARDQYVLAFARVPWRELRDTFAACTQIGIIGFLVGGYEGLDVLLLSKGGSFSDLAYYSGAQRLVWPMLMTLAAVGGTFYPVIAAHWPHARKEFETTCQRALDTVMVLAGLPLSAVLAGAVFFMSLIGGDLKAGAPVLSVLAVLCMVKAVSGVLGPVFYILKAQRLALQFIGTAMVVKALALWVLAPRYGYMGVAFGALGVETLFATIPAIFFFQKLTGYRIKWSIPIRVVSITAASGLTPRLVGAHGLAGAIMAPLLYCVLALVTGVTSISAIRSLMPWNRQ